MTTLDQGSEELPALLRELPVELTEKVVFGLEGDWSPTAVEVWSRERGRLGFESVIANHPTHRPSLELYLLGGWVGLPCWRRERDGNRFDEPMASRILDYVEARAASAEAGH